MTDLAREIAPACLALLAWRAGHSVRNDAICEKAALGIYCGCSSKRASLVFKAKALEPRHVLPRCRDFTLGLNRYNEDGQDKRPRYCNSGSWLGLRVINLASFDQAQESPKAVWGVNEAPDKYLGGDMKNS